MATKLDGATVQLWEDVLNLTGRFDPAGEAHDQAFGALEVFMKAAGAAKAKTPGALDLARAAYRWIGTNAPQYALQVVIINMTYFKLAL